MHRIGLIAKRGPALTAITLFVLSAIITAMPISAHAATCDEKQMQSEAVTAPGQYAECTRDLPGGGTETVLCAYNGFGEAGGWSCGTRNNETKATVTETNDNAGGFTNIATDGEGKIVSASGGNSGTDAAGKLGLAAVLGPVALISYLILALSSWLLGLVGVIFNFAVANLVFDFGNFFGNTPGMLAAWGVLRDIGNIALLFGFIFMGIQTILDIGHFSVGKAIPRLLIFAVLMNFSLFAAQAVIDVSNVLAASVYTQVNTQNCALTSSDQGSECAYDNNYGVSGMIVQQAGVGSVFSFVEIQKGVVSNLQAAAEYVDNPVQETLKYLGLSILVTTLWVVLLAGAVLLIARGVQLALLMVTSPIGFAGMAIPPLEEQARKWWKSLMSQAFFAPVYLLLIFVGLKIMESVTSLSAGGEIGSNTPNLASAITSQNVTGMTALLSYGLVVGFMIAALLAAKKFGIAGADIITKTATGTIGNLTAGGIGFAYRRTAGAASNAVARNIRNSRFGTTLGGKLLAQTADIGAKASFDPRGKGLKLGGADFGKPSDAEQKGRRGVLEEAGKKEYEYAKTVKNARKETDKGYEQTSKDLQREEKLAQAKAAEATKKAEEARASGNTAAAEGFTKEAEKQLKKAEKASADRKQNDIDLKSVQINRLSKDDQLLRNTYGAAGKGAADKLKSESAKASEYAAQAAVHMKEAANQAERIAKLEKDKAGYRDAARIAEADRQIAEAGSQRDIAEALGDAATKQAEATKAGLDSIKKEVAANKKSEEGYLKSDYAMEQYARNLEETARSIIGKTVVDAAKLRAGANGIRSESGKSEEQQAWDHLQHIFHEKAHGGHGDEGAEKHADADHAADAKPH